MTLVSFFEVWARRKENIIASNYRNLWKHDQRDDQNVKEIHAHSNILCARSQYFRTAFSNEWAEKRDGKFIFRKSNISPQLFNIILRFIYCGNIELKNLQGSELLYRSSQDGIDTNSFHKNCDDKGATIWIAKIKNSTQLIGGYNPLNWDSRHPHWVATADSFIFNFINGGNISTSKVSYVKKQDRAVLCNNNFGPTMGNIYCNNNNWSNENRGYGEVYPSIEIPKNFEVEDYEVFQVIKNGKSKVIMEFTMLNDNFRNRINDENREVNEKNVNEKRLENRPPGGEADKQFKEKLINLC
ncbi:BTB/POZ protein [Rhizophagus irregularis DAOM 181602=DAOM 197198]|nr:BTB/POZ protein [Rhizophagus irregularis DAOM 181602=DAOM 197198]